MNTISIIDNLKKDFSPIKQMIINMESKRLGELAFKFHDTYGLPKETIFEIIKEEIKSEEYMDNLISCFLPFKSEAEYLKWKCEQFGKERTQNAS